MLSKLSNKIIAFISLVVILLFMLFGSGFRRSIDGDVLGYYIYLPATFIYHNNKSLDVVPTNKHISQHLLLCFDGLKAHKTPKGYPQDGYTIGVAIMEAPFFFIAHAWETANKLDANGYSDTYYNLIIFGWVFYAVFGLVLLYKILWKFFPETQSLLAVLTVFFASNLFWFTLFQAGMSHVPIFFLYTVLMYATIKIHERPGSQYFLLAGLAAGMITLIRPVDIICLLVPLLYNVYDRDTLRQKIKLIGANATKMLLASVAFFIVLVPQLMYWKEMSGSYVFYSYGEQGFDWKHPKIIEGLFYGYNGWLAYTPVMVFALAGLVLYKKIKSWAWILWLILPVYIYIIYSWYCYIYINGFGSRPMINLYPLLAIPLAAFMGVIAQRGKGVKIAAGLLFVFLASANVSYSLQQGKWLMFSDGSNMLYNMQVLFKTHLSYNDLVTYDIAATQPDTAKLTKVATLAVENFEDSTSDSYVKDTAFGSKYVYRMGNDEYLKKLISLPYNNRDIKDATWFKCTGRFMYPSPSIDVKHLLVFAIDGVTWRGCTIENKIDILDGTCPPDEIKINHFTINKWGYVSFFVKIPHHVPDGKSMALFVWNIGKSDIYVDNLRLDLYK